jgi:hypothetical protein
VPPNVRTLPFLRRVRGGPKFGSELLRKGEIRTRRWGNPANYNPIFGWAPAENLHHHKGSDPGSFGGKVRIRISGRPRKFRSEVSEPRQFGDPAIAPLDFGSGLCVGSAGLSPQIVAESYPRQSDVESNPRPSRPQDAGLEKT